MEKLITDVSKLSKRLDKTKGSVQAGTKALVPLELEPDVRDILSSLRDTISALISLSAENKVLSTSVKDLSSKVRALEDSNEFHHQRSLRGKFFISFPKDSHQHLQKN